jgi:pSer/pThr/pTyr-binding forkhead associated (FHA) protein
MSDGLLQILRYFLLALLWLFFLYAARTVIVDVRRGRRDAAAAREDENNDTPTQVRDFRLRIVEPRQRHGEVTRISNEVTLGRSPTCSVSLDDDAFVSSVHARIFVLDGEAYLEDLNSKNGTYLNEEPVTAPTQLERGDLVRVGDTVFELRR